MAAQNENIVFDSTTFRIRLAQIMKDRGFWTSSGPDLTSVAPGLNMSTAALSRYLNGRRNPDIGYLLQIAKFFQVSTDWLLGLSENKEIPYSSDTPANANLPENESAWLVDMFQKASPNDREIVKVILGKYEG